MAGLQHENFAHHNWPNAWLYAQSIARKKVSGVWKYLSAFVTSNTIPI